MNRGKCRYWAVSIILFEPKFSDYQDAYLLKPAFSSLYNNYQRLTEGVNNIIAFLLIHLVRTQRLIPLTIKDFTRLLIYINII